MRETTHTATVSIFNGPQYFIRRERAFHHAFIPRTPIRLRCTVLRAKSAPPPLLSSPHPFLSIPLPASSTVSFISAALRRPRAYSVESFQKLTSCWFCQRSVVPAAPVCFPAKESSHRPSHIVAAHAGGVVVISAMPSCSSRSRSRKTRENIPAERRRLVRAESWCYPRCFSTAAP